MEEVHVVERASSDDHAALHLPEPMVFDLVRGLGAARNELEANVLVFVPFRRGRSTSVGWAPEIEWAPTKGFAVELELPLIDAELVAVKGALQWTFPSRPHAPVLHGTQWIVEGRLDEPVVETTGLYLVGWRMHPRWSLLAMLGLRVDAPTQRDHGHVHVHALTNLGVFADLHSRVTLGVETNLARPLEGGMSTLRVIPQLHVGIVRHLRLQLGGGLLADPVGVAPILASRLVVER